MYHFYKMSNNGEYAIDALCENVKDLIKAQQDNDVKIYTHFFNLVQLQTNIIKEEIRENHLLIKSLIEKLNK